MVKLNTRGWPANDTRSRYVPIGSASTLSWPEAGNVVACSTRLAKSITCTASPAAATTVR